MQPHDEEPYDGGPATCISVVIATRNRPSNLLTVLASLLEGTEQRFDIVVVDQSDDDASQEAVDHRYGWDTRIRYVRDAKRGAAKARNAGFRAARADIIAITDDDCVIPPTWLADILRAFERYPDVDMLFGSVLAAPHDYRRAVIPELRLSRRQRRLERGLFGRGARLQGMSANMALRRRLLQSIGGFDPLFGVGGKRWSGEDFELHYRALHAGKHVLIEPAIAVCHVGERTMSEAWDLWRRDALGCGAVTARIVSAGHLIVGARLWWWYVGRLWWKAAFHAALLRRPTNLRLAWWMDRHFVEGFCVEWRDSKMRKRQDVEYA